MNHSGKHPRPGSVPCNHDTTVLSLLFYFPSQAVGSPHGRLDGNMLHYDTMKYLSLSLSVLVDGSRTKIAKKERGAGKFKAFQ